MSSSISYFDKFVKPLNQKDTMEYKRYLNLKALFLEGYFEVPEMPKFEEVSKYDENEDDNWLSVWYINNCHQEIQRIISTRNEPISVFTVCLW